MRKPHPFTKAFAVAAAGAVVLAGCSAVDDTPSTGDGNTAGDSTDEATGDSTDDSSDEAAGEIRTDVGVTDDACPEAVNPDNGCIYLGILSDLTEGPFAALAVPIVNAQRAYWAKVNADGGIAGYDVDIDTNTRDTKYQPAEHANAYNQISGNVLALAQSLGTVNTEAMIDDMDANDIVAVPASWWSGAHFSENDRGLILEFGYSYCTESIVGLDWLTETHGKPEKIAAVGYPGDYGGDSAAGVQKWAAANDLADDAVTVIPTGPNQVTGGQDAVVSAVAAAAPDAVVLAVGPAENAEIVGKLAAGGFTGRFLGSVPTWNPALLQSAAAPALTAMYNHMTFAEGWDGESAGVAAMKEALAGDSPQNAGYVAGWVMSYPMHALLEKAAENGDLTRAGVRAAVDGLSVDFEGMSGAITYGGDGADVAAIDMIVAEPNDSNPLGTVMVGDWFTGTTFEKVDYTAACSASS